MNTLAFEKEIGISFSNKNLIETALTHTSYAYEHHVESNEKLEFLGDAVLEYIISSYLFDKFKSLSEGEMTKTRASVVCEDSLYEIALKHNFNKYINLGKSEISSGENKRKALLADSVEAVIAAIYLDSGIEEARKFIIENLSKSVENASRNVGKKDYKTVLQEKLQVHGDVNIEYKTVKEEGPDHDKKFTVELWINGKRSSTGEGSSKKSAEMEAARKALNE